MNKPCASLNQAGRGKKREISVHNVMGVSTARCRYGLISKHPHRCRFWRGDLGQRMRRWRICLVHIMAQEQCHCLVFTRRSISRIAVRVCSPSADSICASSATASVISGRCAVRLTVFHRAIQVSHCGLRLSHSNHGWKVVRVSGGTSAGRSVQPATATAPRQ